MPSRVIIWTKYNGQESPMLHNKFCGNPLADSGEDFWRVFATYGHGGHLGHVTSVISTNFHFHVPKSLLAYKIWLNGPGVSEKSMFKFSYINGLGPRSRDDLDPNPHNFINSISCLHLPTFRSQAAIVSENPQFSLPIEKHKLPNLTLP